MNLFTILLITTLGIFLIIAFKKPREFALLYIPEFLNIFAAIGFSAAGILNDSTYTFIGDIQCKDIWIYLLIASALLLFISIFILHKRKKKIINAESLITANKQIKDKLRSVDDEYYKLCSDIIYWLFKEFYQTGEERVSIYKHQGDHFTLLGRSSKNPKYRNRTTYNYNEDEGIIGKGWQNGECLLQDAPPWKSKGREYKSFMKEQSSITDERLTQIKMHSRSLFAKTIQDHSSPNQAEGIIVFESMSPTQTTKEQCSKLLEDNIQKTLTLLKNMKSLTNKLEK